MWREARQDCEITLLPAFFCGIIMELSVNKQFMNPVETGVASSFITELLKFIPFLRSSTIIQAVLSIVVTCIVTLVSKGDFSFNGIVLALIVSLTTYKTLTEPLADAVGSKSQA